MGWIFLLMGLIWMLLAPLSLDAAALHDGLTRIRLVLGVGQVRKTLRLRIVATPKGHQIILGEAQEAVPLSPTDMRGSRAERMARRLLKDKRARRFLLRHTELERLDGLLSLHTEDAARSALLAGTLQGATSFLPPSWRRNVRLAAVPAFFQPRTTVHLRCIIRVKLGTLIITAALLLLAKAGRKKEA